MRYRARVTVTVVLGCWLIGRQASAEVFAYPKKGQSQEQFEQDQFQCHKWAKGQTGIDPTKPPQSAAAAEGRGRARLNVSREPQSGRRRRGGTG